MQIGVLGAGAVGTLFAYRFARAGHGVTLVARGERLLALRRAEGVVRVRALAGGKTEDVRVSVAETLEALGEVDLLLVTVRRQHADALLADVARSKARRVVFVFNAAGDLARYCSAVGRERFVWLFPAVVARLAGEVLEYSLVPAWLRVLQITTVGGLAGFEAPALAELRPLLAGAGLPYAVCSDMQSWLRTHAAFMAPLIACGSLSQRRGALSRADAALVARALRDGFRLVRRTGSRVTPWNLAVLSRVPALFTAVVLWCAFRLAGVRRALGGVHARDEAQAMLDELVALAPGGAGNVETLRKTLAERG